MSLWAAPAVAEYYAISGQGGRKAVADFTASEALNLTGFSVRRMALTRPHSTNPLRGRGALA
ncbi:hypothetical protein CHELA40_10835 [Chelatococcus asaccharovorans]|nr:hypothetical protein CHELA40_10835 [Chelatococcus asaccharovorans]CAH1685959.1 hypothetical protein CHELA17_64767 [Chelatococcus asaccharovorans]